MYYIPQLCQLLPVLNKLLQPLWDDRSQQSDESPAILAMFENSAGELLHILIEEDLAQLIRETGSKNHTEWPSL
jgi:hypothetical protein